MSGGSSSGEYPNYDKEYERCLAFLKEFRVEIKGVDDTTTNGSHLSSSSSSSSSTGHRHNSHGTKHYSHSKYLELIRRVMERRAVEIVIDLDDIVLHNDASLADEIIRNTSRYIQLFSKAIDAIIEEYRNNNGINGSSSSSSSSSGNAIFDPTEAVIDNEDTADVLLAHRMQLLKQNQQQEAALQDPNNLPTEAELRNQLRAMFPATLFRRYEVRFRPREVSEKNELALRQIKANDLGKLVTVRAIVLRASEVRPILQVAAYTCDTCGYEIHQEITSRTFMPVPLCISEPCTKNGSAGKVRMVTRGCKFQKYQEIKIQELPEQVPVGHIPRTMTVIARGECVRRVVPGDIVTLGGVFLPTPYTGFQAMRAGLTTDTYLEAHTLTKLKKQDTAINPEAEALIGELARDEYVYDKLSRSIAPEIFGHEDVKKALLLQLVSGMTRKQKDGMKTRGDIHLCLMGDPGVAKSQLLKHIAKLAPRCVYTTGKGSSGVGLTAAVMRDPMTNELTLEGGALVLADMGICCIDEFDKMEEKDRTAIHEVMEQQTVSIAKAGITTTLNARTAVLAAANPRYGRYNRYADRDPQVSLLKNINLPAALLSRFDLMFLLLDEVDAANDRALAEHVTYVHQKEQHPPLNFTPVEPSIIRQYVAVCKHIPTHIPPEITNYVTEAYVDMRSRDKSASARSGGRGTMTARQLLSILRIAEALARLHLRTDVNTNDIDEAIRLVQMSKASVDEPVDDAELGTRASATDKIYHLIAQRARENGYVLMNEIKQAVQQLGYTDTHLETTLAEYTNLGILSVNPSHTRIDIVGRA